MKPKKHQLKIWPEYYQAVKNFKKLYEFRKFDREYLIGDYLILNEWDPKTKKYTRNEPLERKISHIYEVELDGIDYMVLGFDFNHTLNEKNKSEACSIQLRKQKFQSLLRPFLEKGEYSRELLNDFYGYWTEHGDNDKKMRFEKQTSFSVSRRLATWKKRSEKEPTSEKKEMGTFSR